MTLVAQVRKADDLVVSVHDMTPQNIAAWGSDVDTFLVPITQAQFDLFKSTTRYHEGSSLLRYQWVDPNFVITADPRPVVTFTPIRVQAEIGEVVTVQIEHSGGLDGMQEFSLADVPMRIDFVAGIAAAVAIDTSAPDDYSIRSQQGFRVAAPLHVTVYSRTLGPR